MADDVLQDAAPAPDAGKAKREPPTIDLEATQISEKVSEKASETPASDSKAEASRPETEARSEPPKQAESAQREPESRRASPWLVAPLSGLVAAAVVLAVGAFLGWPETQAPPATPQVSPSAFDDLNSRVARLETKLAKLPGTDSAVTARIEAAEKSMTALRGDLANLRTQAEQLAAAVNNASKLATGEAAAAPAADLSGVNARIDQVERNLRAQSDKLGAAIAQASQTAASAKAQDDTPLRRVVAAALLDVAVRHGDPFAAALTTAKALAADPDKLKPLDVFADKGIPAPPALCRDLLTLVPKLSPAAETSSTGSGIIDRLQAGASSLVRVERSDAVGNDRSAVVTRMTAAALRNDLPDARRELASLDAADRAPAQPWLDKVAARDAALAASRQFAEETMASLAKSAQ
ncbi:MAG: hypothetical protein JO141_05945 [Bradyrhizobium sp.]|nr:hypothetical protein [Bradyrhizobium sp.]